MTDLTHQNNDIGNPTVKGILALGMGMQSHLTLKILRDNYAPRLLVISSIRKLIY